MFGGIFNDRTALWQLQEAATSFSQDNPHFNQLKDVLAGLAYNTSSSNLHPADSRGLGILLSTLQNSIPGMGTPVADFVAMNRALISGAIPLTVTRADGQSSISNSYGTGNVSIAASASIMRTFEDSMRTAGGAVDISQTRGVSHNLRTDLLTHLVQQRGIKENDFRTFDLSGATTSDALTQQISLMSNKYDVEESSLRDLRKVRDAMKYLETESVFKGRDLTKIDDDTLAGHLAGKFDDATIRQATAQIKGNNKVFQTQTKQLNRELKEAYEAVADNVKELSHLFGTEDLDKLKNYAKGIGVGSFLDKDKAHEVRAQMRDIAVTAAVTGRSAQEVAAERVSIAAGMSAMYGGRAPSSGLIDVVQNAGIAASQAKNGGTFTNEASKAAAARSVANMQNVYGDAIVATGIFKEQEKIGGITQAQREEYNNLYAAMQSATTLEDRRRAAVRLGTWARATWGNTAMNSPEMRARMLANYSEDFQEMHVESLIAGNMKTHARNIARKNGLSEDEQARLEGVGADIISMFGNDEASRNKFFKLVDDGDLNAAMNMLKTGGMENEEALSLVSRIRSFGKGRLSSMLNPMLSGSAWIQQIGNGRLGQAARNVKFVTELLSRKEIGYRDDSSAIGQFISGMIGEGGLTQQGVLDAELANAMLRSDNAEQQKANVDALGIDAINIGKLDDKTGSFVVESPEQRKMLMDKLGITDEEEFNKLLRSPERYVKRLEAAGFMISTTKDRHNGGLLAASRDAVAARTEAMSKSVDGDNIRALQKVFGDSVDVRISQGRDGKFATTVSVDGGEYKNVDEVIADMSRDPSKLSGLLQMGDMGSAEAKAAVHSILSKSLTEDINGDGRAEVISSGRLNKLATEDKNITAAEYRAAAQADYGPQIEALLQQDWTLQKSMLVEAGYAAYDHDGKLRLTRDISGLNLSANTELEDDTISGAIDRVTGRRSQLTKIQTTLNSLSGDTEAPPDKSQMNKVITHLRQIEMHLSKNKN